MESKREKERDEVFRVELGIGKEREMKLVDVRWTRERHAEVVGMWVKRKQKCLPMELGQRVGGVEGWRGGGVGMRGS